MGGRSRIAGGAAAPVLVTSAGGTDRTSAADGEDRVGGRGPVTSVVLRQVHGRVGEGERVVGTGAGGVDGDPGREGGERLGGRPGGADAAHDGLGGAPAVADDDDELLAAETSGPVLAPKGSGHGPGEADDGLVP